MKDKFLKFKRLTGYDWTCKHVTLQDIKTKSYRRVHKNPCNFYLEKHFKGELILVLPQYPNSNILKIDIDKRNNKHSMEEVIDKIVKYFGDSVYLEKGLSGGYHLFYSCNEKITTICKKEIEKYFKNKYDFIIEIKKGQEELKLPLSRFYPEFGFYDIFESDRIIKALHKDDDYLVNINRLTDLFEHQEKIRLPLQFKKFNLLGEKLQHTKSNSIQTIIRNESFDDIIDKILLKYYSYGAGTRFQTQYKIAKFCIENNYTYNDFIYACERCNQYNSKDMADPLSKEKKLKEAWEYGLKIADINEKSKNTNIKYIKQNYSLTNEEIKKVKYILNVYLKMNKTIKYKKNKNRIINNCLLLYQEIVGRYFYNKKNDIKYKEDFSYLNDSIALGKTLLTKIIKELNLNNGPLIKKILLKTSLIKETTNSKGYSYSFKQTLFTKHFKLNNLLNLYNKYIIMYKKFINNIYNILINNKSKILNYYYRSLIYVNKIYNDRKILYDEIV